jgi:hypothetical protein
MKLFNEQHNAQDFNLIIYVHLPYNFGLSFSPSSEKDLQLRHWFKPPGYGFSACAQALTPYPGDSNHCRRCTSAFEAGLKESPKHVRHK